MYEFSRYQKLQVIEYLKNGMKNKDLSEKYKVHHSAISKIIHNKDKAGPVLQAKAKQFHASLNVNWLARFKKRHGIICLNIKGEKLSANEDDASAFREGLKAFLENHGYKEVENWIDKDQYEPPYKVFNDSQLIEIAKGGIEESDSEEELLNSNNNKDSDEESPNFPPPPLDEVLPSILQIRRWSRGNKIVTVEENRSLDSLMEKMVQLKINIL
ncbi:hypothetical protein NQ318_017679 [Aromia moschata]|uniref:HTH CENPB-type domain-containing protein n=1 Tax=Aromia moschata TaxID=1265417 RepID=A0AAV8X8H2_9CUCU|nr:hypothetical protein NQ318_017679 [Aromia moschata]